MLRVDPICNEPITPADLSHDLIALNRALARLDQLNADRQEEFVALRKKITERIARIEAEMNARMKWAYAAGNQ